MPNAESIESKELEHIAWCAENQREKLLDFGPEIAALARELLALRRENEQLKRQIGPRASKRSVIAYTACPDCSCWSVGMQANGRIVRHSRGFGSVEKVGPGTRHPRWKTQICSGSGRYVGKP